MDQSTRNTLRNVVTQCRKLLEESVAQVLQGQFGIYAAGKKDEVQIEPEARMSHLSEEDRAYRQDLLDHYEHIKALGYKAKDALAQLIREVAFTHLNRFCAYRMMESRGLIRESVSKGLKSQGFLFYLADHEEDERRFNTGQQDVAYRHFLNWLGGTLSEEIGVLFAPTDPANRLYPPQRVIDQVLGLLNDPELAGIWSEDEAIGWVYQYFTPKELRDQARKESQAPRNSYELAFRNQFFTPRYVVEFLTDNTLGRIWYEMRQGNTRLKDQCRYMVRRPTEVFLKDGEAEPKDAATATDDLPQQELLKLPVYVPFRAKKDPRELRILDPACGSGHFLLYCFDLLLTIYEEAFGDLDLGPALKNDYPTLEALRRDVPRLILAHNLHGIDIDPRASQIAALALWLRCQRAYQDMGIKQDRPKITRSNIVCAEPMPGEAAMLKEFVSQLEPKVLGQVVEVVFDKMKLAGEAGSLLRIEEEIRDAVATAKKLYARETTNATDRKGHPLLFSEAEFGRLSTATRQESLFDVSDITDETFFEQAEKRVAEALHRYAEKAKSSDGLSRSLFSNDVVRGFAFVDLCRNRFDAVLMNPPFGNPVAATERLLTDFYPNYGGDILTAFISRGVALAPNGYVGAITSRTAFYLPTFVKWREETLFGFASLQCCADLGADVLDEALVEAFLTVIGSDSSHVIPSIRVNRIPATDKGEHLRHVVLQVTDGNGHRDAFAPLRRDLYAIPKCAIAYSAARQLCQSFAHGTALTPHMASVQQGMSTKNDFRFLRLAHEVDPGSLDPSRWAYIAKGGEYRPFYDDIHLVVKAHDDFADLKQELLSKYPYLKGNTDWVLHPESEYFVGGLTYPERTTSAFGPRLMPSNCFFSHVGLGIIARNGCSQYLLLGWLMARPLQLQIELQAGSADAVESGSAARHYSKSLIESLYVVEPDAFEEHEEVLRSVVLDVAVSDLRVETSRLFAAPVRHLGTIESLRGAARKRYDEYEEAALRIVQAFDRIDELAEQAFGLNDSELLDEEVRRRPCLLPSTPPDEEVLRHAMECSEDALIDLVVDRCGFHRSLSKKCYVADRRLELMAVLCGRHPEAVSVKRRDLELIPPGEDCSLAMDVISYLFGVLFGRWDIRICRTTLPESLTVADVTTIPQVPAGMLVGDDGLPARASPNEYPINVGWAGVLVDDPAQGLSDVVLQFRKAAEWLWGANADNLEHEACHLLNVKELRDYFRKPGKGGFWDDHISRYSKSRRKAPIYWLLQSSKKNYALWLYYHRLDKDILFKALVNYVEPKIRLENDRLESLRAQKGEGGKATKKLDKEIEKQEEFLSELRDFEEKLRRAAELHLVPDLNDGVVLNIAPLHELVPWKEAEKYWEELLEGKYEWSSIGKQLREKGLVN